MYLSYSIIVTFSVGSTNIGDENIWYESFIGTNVGISCLKLGIDWDWLFWGKACWSVRLEAWFCRGEGSCRAIGSKYCIGLFIKFDGKPYARAKNCHKNRFFCYYNGKISFKTLPCGLNGAWPPPPKNKFCVWMWYSMTVGFCWPWLEVELPKFPKFIEPWDIIKSLLSMPFF